MRPPRAPAGRRPEDVLTGHGYVIAGSHLLKASASASARLTPPLLPLPPLLSPNPALRYSVMIPKPCVPQGKRRSERLRNLVLLSSGRHPLVHAPVVTGQPPSVVRPWSTTPSGPAQPPSVVRTLVPGGHSQLCESPRSRRPGQPTVSLVHGPLVPPSHRQLGEPASSASAPSLAAGGLCQLCESQPPLRRSSRPASVSCAPPVPDSRLFSRSSASAKIVDNSIVRKGRCQLPRGSRWNAY